MKSKSLLTIGFLTILLLSISCKKKTEVKENICNTQSLLLGKWKFVSRKVTDYKTGNLSTPATNTTVNFDKESYIEFTSDNKFRWYEIYNNKVYRDQNGTTLCLPNDNFLIYSNQATGTGIAESIKELTTNKLIFVNNVLGTSGDWRQTVTLELYKEN